MLHAQRLWRERVAPDDIVAELEHDMEVCPLIARLLAIRGVESAEHAYDYLSKQLKNLTPPEQLRDMEKAAQRFADAINKQENILIHGDYDVDGSTSTTLLKQFCQACSHDAIAWIPRRRIEGYGLSESSRDAAKEHQAHLLITVDCGIADGGWAQRIEQEANCDVIITDHHLPQKELPNCFAICNPNHPECTYPDKGLAGVGVAWKLCWATAKKLSGSEKVTDRLRSFLMESLALVAVGTVADCAPLDKENRILVHHGLLALERTSNPGLRAMLERTRLLGTPIQANDIGWKLGPLLNASGRLSSAMRNVELLCAQDSSSAETILDAICEENDERRRLTSDLCEEIFSEIESNPSYLKRNSLVFYGDNWHQGIVGIVASRLVDRYKKPAAVIGIVDGVGKGSLRTIPGVHLGHAIDGCREHITSGGGHAMAAGITLDADKATAFAQTFEAFIVNEYPGGLPKAATDYDCMVDIADVDASFFEQFQRLAPFGALNPQPVIRIKNSKFVTTPRSFGKAANHLRGAITNGNGGMQEWLAWNCKEQMHALCQNGNAFDMLLSPEINVWQGQAKPRLLFVDGKSM